MRRSRLLALLSSALVVHVAGAHGDQLGARGRQRGPRADHHRGRSGYLRERAPGLQELRLQRIRLTTSLLNGGANFNGRLIIMVRYRDEPDDVREITLPMPGLPSPAAKKVLVVSSTQEFMDSDLVKVEGSTRNTPKVCSREVYEGDYRQSLVNAPAVGSDCQFRFILDAAYWRTKFEVMAWNWSGLAPPDPDASNRPRCHLTK